MFIFDYRVKVRFEKKPANDEGGPQVKSRRELETVDTL